jgi:hypothetical protein
MSNLFYPIFALGAVFYNKSLVFPNEYLLGPGDTFLSFTVMNLSWALGIVETLDDFIREIFECLPTTSICL